MNNEQLRELTAEAKAAGAAGDASAANGVLRRLTGINDAEFQAFGLDDLKLVIEAASVVGQIGDPRLVGSLFARSINTMQTLKVADAEYILPLYNLRACYLSSGASDAANRVLPQIVEAARRSEIVSGNAMRALNELIPEFVNAGYSEAAVILYRPIFQTMLARPELGCREKAEVAARYGRLQLADGRAPDAVETYRETLEGLDVAGSDPEATHARMTLWYLTAEAHAAGGSKDAAETAYETAISVAQESDDADSREAGIVYHNAAAFWFGNRVKERYPEAISLTKRALAIAERLGETDTSNYAASLGQLANLHAELGDTAAAQRYFDDCFTAFAAAKDADPADVADYRDDEGNVWLSSGQAERAAASFSAALEIRGAIAGFSRDKLADTYGWLGVARFEQGDCSQASEAFREAIQLRLGQRDRDAQRGDPR